MDCNWKAWTTAITAHKALRVGQRLLKALGATNVSVHVQPYPKTNGHVLSFSMNVGRQPWVNGVVTVISIAQKVAGGWQLFGNISEELEMISKRSTVTGVNMLSCSITRVAASTE